MTFKWLVVTATLVLVGCDSPMATSTAGDEPTAIAAAQSQPGAITAEMPSGEMNPGAAFGSNTEAASSGPKASPVGKVPSEQGQDDLRILAWNIESDGSNTDVIIEQLRTQMPVFDILALSEVPPEDTERLSQFFPGGQGAIDASRGDDRLTLAWTKRYQFVKEVDLRSDEFAPGYHRAPLGVHLLDTNTGERLVVLNNHLARGNAELRIRQAEILVEWARGQTLPVVAVGDYNMDYEFSSGKGNNAFAAMLNDSIFKWVRPSKLVDTNWYDPDGDGVDNYDGSLLDFTFATGPALKWEIKSEVVVREGDFPDDETTSDHRPLLTTIKVTP